MHGTASISKVVGSTFLSESRRQEMNERIRTAIETLNVQSIPAYRKLMEEVGIAYSGPAYSAQASSPSPLNGSSPVYEQRSPTYQGRRGSSPRDQRSGGVLAVPSTPHRQPWSNPQNSAQYPMPPPPPPFMNYSPYNNQMQYPPTFQGPYGSQFPYGGPSSPSYPPYHTLGQENGGGNREPPAGLSPILTHAPPPPGSGGSGPFSPPPGYPFSPGGDPYSALRLNNHVGFNPQFSPMSSPPPAPPFYGHSQSFSQQQQNGEHYLCFVSSCRL